MKGLVRNTAWAGASELTRAAAGTLSFVLLARALGPGPFGHYAGSLALIWALMPFATLGQPQLIVMRVSRRPDEFARHWANALVATAIGGLAATAVILGVRPLLLGSVPFSVLAVLALSEFLGSSLGEVAAGAAQARDRISVCARVRMINAILRLVAAAAFFVTGQDSLRVFPLFQLVACALGAVLSVTVIVRMCGRPGSPERPTLRSLSAGLPFSFSNASFMTQDGFDKTVLVRSGFAVQAGAYAAAYRFVMMALLPITALLQATYTRFFNAGSEGLASSWRLGRRLIGPAVAYGIVVGAGALAFAPLLGAVLGDQYGDSVDMIRALAFLPLLRITQYFPANALSGAGYQKIRGGCQAATAGLTVVLCFALIPSMGWTGAVLATLVAEVAFAAGVWTALAVLLRREAATAAAPGAVLELRNVA